MGFDYTVSSKDKGLTYIFLEQAKKQEGFDSTKEINWQNVMSVFDKIQKEENAESQKLFSGGNDKTRAGWGKSYIIKAGDKISLSDEQMNEIYSAMGLKLSQKTEKPQAEQQSSVPTQTQSTSVQATTVQQSIQAENTAQVVQVDNTSAPVTEQEVITAPVQIVDLPNNIGELFEKAIDGIQSMAEGKPLDMEPYQVIENSMSLEQKQAAEKLFTEFWDNAPVKSVPDASLGTCYSKGDLGVGGDKNNVDKIKPHVKTVFNMMIAAKDKYIKLLDGEKDLGSFQSAEKYNALENEGDWGFMLAYNYFLETLDLELDKDGKLVLKQDE